jgi:hypothetical protein
MKKIFLPRFGLEVRGNRNEGRAARDFSVSQNYPNPFNPVTHVDVFVGRASRVSVKVFDLLGQEIAVIADEFMAPGTYTFTFDASALASGVYSYQMRAGEFVETRKFVLAK